jgi:Arc/MetJ-type ribon-helix-helix transcriptional regulator
MDRKTIRFSDATVEHAEALVEDGAYPSFSAAIRDQLPGEWPGIGTEGEDE